MTRLASDFGSFLSENSITLSLILIVIFAIIIPLVFRRVVPTNEVHVVQSSKKTRSHGKDTPNGNVYYEWPSWVPIIGITKITLPVSVFDLSLRGYEAYDVGRVPFVVDVVAFFRIENTNIAAQRVESFDELHNQLTSIVQGAVRTILAKTDIDKIMLERATFGEQFTNEVKAELENWGVTPVKNMELMDIRDGEESHVISNIMEKKKSLIEKESRIEVAENIKEAKVKEIEASQQVQVREQESQQVVGERTAEKDKAVGIANEIAQQKIKEQKRETTEKDMAILKVNEVRNAEIAKEKAVVKANEDKETTVIVATGDLEATVKEAEGIKVEGEARADAERQMQLAPVEAQIVLAKEIGENEGYQQYLISVRGIEANEIVGMEQAKALTAADVKVITNSGEPISGVKNVMDLFSSKGGTEIGSMLEGLQQSAVGESLLKKFGVKPDKDISVTQEVELEDERESTVEDVELTIAPKKTEE